MIRNACMYSSWAGSLLLSIQHLVHKCPFSFFILELLELRLQVSSVSDLAQNLIIWSYEWSYVLIYLHPASFGVLSSYMRSNGSHTGSLKLRASDLR